ncbi:outer membrane beta-barrel protein [Negadavirga shengliensis]|uniref:Outer membrane beta-barrel protein n=1 Tax=Negadavirga shengliensis TaxID=1389218 RepID=A0ABV9T6C1_9BACT
MIRIVWIAVMFLFAGTVTQELKAQHIGFGVRAGTQLSNIPQLDVNTLVGYHFGGYYQYQIKDKWMVEPAIMYSQKGIKDKLNYTTHYHTDRFKYLDVPVLLKYNVTGDFDLIAGPQASLFLFRSSGYGSERETSKEAVKGYDLAGVLGLGYHGLPFGLNLQATAEFGVIDTNYTDQSGKNQLFRFSVGKSF